MAIVDWPTINRKRTVVVVVVVLLPIICAAGVSSRLVGAVHRSRQFREQPGAYVVGTRQRQAVSSPLVSLTHRLGARPRTASVGESNWRLVDVSVLAAVYSSSSSSRSHIFQRSSSAAAVVIKRCQ